ncbi:hypothetical protein ACWDA9_23080, partial [Streptomyces sp. NPDC001193]
MESEQSSTSVSPAAPAPRPVHRAGPRRTRHPGGMARANERVEALLREYADLISISGGDAFKA